MAPSRTQPQAPTESWGEELGSGTFITWNEPKVVIGTLTATKVTTSGKYATPTNPGFQITLVLDDGEEVRANCPAALRTRMEQVNIGTRVRIEYDGTTSKSQAGRDVKNFSVRESVSPSFEKLASTEVPI